MAGDGMSPVVVLAGGASRRMGTDKRQVPIDGVPMLRHTLDRLAPNPCVVVIDPRDVPMLALPDHARMVSDTRPGQGPLAGLEAGLLAVESGLVAVVAGDMPWVVPDVLRLLADRLAAAAATDVACLDDGADSRPLPLALRRDRVLPRVTALLDQGERRLRRLLDDAIVVPPASWLPLDPTGATLRDVDTPGDLVEAG